MVPMAPSQSTQPPANSLCNTLLPDCCRRADSAALKTCTCQFLVQPVAFTHPKPSFHASWAAALALRERLPLVYSDSGPWEIPCTIKVGVVHVEESKSLCPRVRRHAVPQPVATNSLDSERHPQRTSRFTAEPGRRIICGLLLALSTLGVSSCHSAAYYYYKFPEYTYAGRPVPPSKLAQRVMIGVTANGSSGSLQIVDALRDIRSNVEDTIPSFQISGYSSGYPGTIFSFPSELRGYVYSNSDGSLTNINYSTEASSGLGRHLPVGLQRSRRASDVYPLLRGRRGRRHPRDHRQLDGATTGSTSRTSSRSWSIPGTRLRWPWCATPTCSTGSSS